MTQSSVDFSTQRTAILHQMAALQSMELGSLKAEFRTSASGQKSGPYYQHQVWREGANLSQRVAPEEAARLQVAIDNRRKFEQLAANFIALTVEYTHHQHAPLALKKKRRSPRRSWPKKPRSRS